MTWYVNHLEHVLVQSQCQPQFVLLWVAALKLDIVSIYFVFLKTWTFQSALQLQWLPLLDPSSAIFVSATRPLEATNWVDFQPLENPTDLHSRRALVLTCHFRKSAVRDPLASHRFPLLRPIASISVKPRATSACVHSFGLVHSRYSAGRLLCARRGGG